MSYRAKVARARQLIAEHNANLPDDKPKLNADKIIGELQVEGGTTDYALSRCNWDDLERCGFPRLLAREVAEVFRQKTPKPNLVETLAKELESATENLVKDMGQATKDIIDIFAPPSVSAISKPIKWITKDSCYCGLTTKMEIASWPYDGPAPGKVSCNCEIKRLNRQQKHKKLLTDLSNLIKVHAQDKYGNWMAPLKITKLVENADGTLKLVTNDGEEWTLSLGA